MINHALDYAQELGDPQLIAYILMRKSNIVTEAGRPGHGLGLANAALKVEGNVTPRTRAVSLRQRARACALLGEQANFEQGIDEALAHAAIGDVASLADPARYCTPSYVTMEAGISWMHLGRPEIAVTTFEESLRKWPDHEQTRDRGLFLARFATVSAALGRVEQACEAASEAVEIAHSTGSARIRAQLASVYNRLEPSAKNPIVQETRHQLAKLGSR